MDKVLFNKRPGSAINNNQHVMNDDLIRVKSSRINEQNIESKDFPRKIKLKNSNTKKLIKVDSQSKRLEEIKTVQNKQSRERIKALEKILDHDLRKENSEGKMNTNLAVPHLLSA